MGAKSADRSVACHDFILTVQHDVGDLAHYNLDWTWAERWQQKYGKRMKACWALRSLSGVPTSSSPTGAALCAHVHVEGSSKQDGSMQSKVKGGHTTGVCRDPWQFTQRVAPFHWKLGNSAGGPCVAGGEACTWREASTPRCRTRQQKMN
jgi:hypothetical protein